MTLVLCKTQTKTSFLKKTRYRRWKAKTIFVVQPIKQE